MRAFIIRPFGTRSGINFDAVEETLIQPALKAAGITGGTTGEFSDSGSIHEDMFLELADAEIVIADVSLHNANVFYELGIRHAIRRKTTVLIKTKVDGNDSAFDISGYRYVSYSAANPGLKTVDLTRSINESLHSDGGDSPVWKHLPSLTSSIKDLTQETPQSLNRDIELYAARKSVGALRLLAQEVRSMRWEKSALRKIASKQFDCEDFRGAEITWRALRSIEGMSYESSIRLGNVYNRLNELALSDQVLIEALSQANLKAEQKAELHSQRARNQKTHWIRDLMGFEPGSSEQGLRSLQSAHLTQALSGYRDAALQDLNSYYAWINYYWFLVVIREQANISSSCSNTANLLADSLGIDLDAELNRARAVVEAALFTATHKSAAIDQWIKWTKADFQLLCSKPEASIESAYRAAYNQDGNTDFQVSAVRRQLEIFPALGVLKNQAIAALRALPNPKPKGRAILFSGLMINKPGRFESSQELAAKDKISQALVALKQAHGNDIFGLAGGACGGDLLFHEACAELGIESRLHLCLPKALFEKRSVASGGIQWINRFAVAFRNAEVQSKGNPHALQILSESEASPEYLNNTVKSFWVRANEWLAHSAMAQSEGRPKIVLLTDGQQGSPGGTFDFYKLADEYNLQISHVIAP
jgi:hypothetical protein